MTITELEEALGKPLSIPQLPDDQLVCTYLSVFHLLLFWLLCVNYSLLTVPAVGSPGWSTVRRTIKREKKTTIFEKYARW